MPTFSSAQVTDPFLSTGELLAPMAAFDTHQNQLYKQQSDQQQIGLTDMATVARAAAPLLGMSETDAAAAYPGIVADLQRQGFAKQAPSTYPGHAVTQSLVQRGMTVPEQIQGGFVTAPGVTDALKAAVAPLSMRGDGSGGGGSVSGPPDPNTPAGAVAQRTATFWAAKGYTPEQVAGIMAAGPGAESSFVPGASGDGGTSYGLYQHHADRLDALKARYGPNPTEAQQNEYAAWEISPDGPYASVGAQLKQAKTPQEAAAIWTKGFESPANADAKAVARAAVAPRYVGYGLPAPKVAVTGQADDAAPAPVAQTKTAMRLNGTDVAGPPGVVPDTTLPPIPAPHQLYQTGLPGVTISGPPSNTLAPPSVAAQAAPPQPVAQSQPPIAQPPTAPAQAQPRTGQNSPQFQAAMELNRRAQALDMVVDPTGRTKALAASLRAQAALYMQADSVTYDKNTGIGTKAITGEQVSPAKPLPHYVYDPNAGGPGVAGFIDTTGTNKPEFEPAQRDTAVAQKTVMELGPRIAAADAGTGPPVSPEDRARYNVAATTYQQFKEITDPVTKQIKLVPTRPLADGLPQPPGTGGSRTLTEGLSPAQQQVERDPAAYKVAESQYDRDSKEIGAIGDVGRQAQADQVRIKEMQDVLQRFSTGSGTEARTAASNWLQRWLPAGVTGWEKESANLSGSDAAQAFSKMALVGAGTQERGVLGARGGYQAIRLFKEANPNVNLQDATNKSILDMQLISNQANQDYSQSALSHFADNETKFGQTHQYESLAQFDRNWNSQRNPQVYAAAMGAISGQPSTQWAKGLSDAEYKRALDIVSRANPSAVVNGKSGRISMQPGGQATLVTPTTPPASGSIQGGYRFKGGDPSSQTNWERVQ